MTISKRHAAAVREAAQKACVSLLLNSGLDKNNLEEVHVLRNCLNELVWTYSGTHDHGGKHDGCPWWSEGAFRVYETFIKKRGDDETWEKYVRLEHVIERKELIDELLTARTVYDVHATLMRSETCVVLREEHRKLPKGGGWERYRRAGITVVPGPKVPNRASLIGHSPLDFRATAARSASTSVQDLEIGSSVSNLRQ